MAEGVGGSVFGAALGGSAIGAAVMKLVLDTKEYDAKLATAGKTTESKLASGGAGFSKFGQYAQAGMLVAGVAVTKFAIDAVGAAREAEAFQLKLANSIANSTKVTSASIPVFQAQAQALRDLTGVDDDAINGMQGFLIQMGLSADQVTQFTPLIVDLSAKMGVSLETAAKAVGKSVNGSTTSLAKMGVVIDKTAAKADPAAATFTALGVAAGFAAEQAKAEPWRLLDAQWQQLQEDAGKKLLPVVKDLVVGMTWFLENLPTVTGDVVLFGAAWTAVNWRVVAEGLFLVRDAVASLAGLAGAASATAGAATLAGKSLATLGAGAYALGSISGVHIDKLKELNGYLSIYHGWLEAGNLSTAEMTKQVAWLTAAYGANSDAVRTGITDGLNYDDALSQINDDALIASKAISDTGAHANAAGKHFHQAAIEVHRFAGMGAKDLAKWKADLETAFNGAIYDLGNLSSKFGVTQKQFDKASIAMERRAKLLDVAMQALGKKSENWVPSEYVKFLADQGPGYLVAFAGETQAAQHKAVAAWKGTNDQVRNLPGLVDKVTGAVKNIPATKKINIDVHYSYTGYDPSMPIPGHP